MSPPFPVRPFWVVVFVQNDVTIHCNIKQDKCRLSFLEFRKVIRNIFNIYDLLTISLFDGNL